MKNTFKTKISIPSYYTDSSMKLGLAACMGIFQDITSNHTDILKIDRASLIKNSNAFWVTTKVKLDILDMPSYDERVTAETWTIKPTAVKVERDARIYNGSQTFVNIKSEWAAIDCQTFKPRPIKSLAFPHSLKNRSDRAIEGRFSPLNYNESTAELCYTRKIYSSDIDINNHVNNCYYSKFVLDCFSLDFLNENRLKTYEIHFVNQCYYGEELSFYKTQTEDGVFVFAKTKDKIIIKCLLTFRKNGK